MFSGIFDIERYSMFVAYSTKCFQDFSFASLQWLIENQYFALKYAQNAVIELTNIFNIKMIGEKLGITKKIEQSGLSS